MYCISQFRDMLERGVVSYASGVEGSANIEDKPKIPGPEGRGDRDPKALRDKADVLTERISYEVNALPNPEHLSGKTEVTPLTPEEMLKKVISSPEERASVRASLPEGKEMTEDQITNAILTQRREDLGTTVSVMVDNGEKAQFTKMQLIQQIAESHGINAALLEDLQVRGQLGVGDMDAQELARRLESMSGEIQRIREKYGENGLDDPAIFLALYEVELALEDVGESDNKAIDSDDELISSSGIKVAEGGGIDEQTPGYKRVGDTVVGPPGAPYSVGGRIYSGSGRVSPDVLEKLDISYSGLEKNTEVPLSNELADMLDNKENKEIIEQRVPEAWHGAAVKLANAESQPLNKDYPIMIASMNDRRGLVCYPDGTVDEFPIIIGAGGTREGVHDGGKTTPTNTVFHFNMNTKVTNVGVDASNSGSTTVLGASIQSQEGLNSGGKWWHGVADSRIPGGATHGCVGASQENMMLAARAVLQAGGGYGFNTESKTGNLI